MEDLVIIAIIGVLFLVGMNSCRKHFQGKGSCCGGGSTYISKKKLKKVIGKKTVIIEGMTCENCKARVERAINDMDGLAAKVNLKKKTAMISIEREVSNEEIKVAIEKAGYTVIEIQ